MSMKIPHPAKRAEGKEPDGGPERGLLLKMELPSDPNLLCAVRGAVERLTESFGFSAEECRAVTRAVDEGLTNIIRHAYSGRPDRPIKMVIHSVQKRAVEGTVEGLEIRLCDCGPAVDPDQLCMRALEEVRPGGLGLHFIQQSMDIVEYKRDNETNCLRLVKYLRAPKHRVNP